MSYPSLRSVAVAAAISLFAPAIAGQCASMTYSGGLFHLRWGNAGTSGHHIEFVPYAGGIVAVVVVSGRLPASLWAFTPRFECSAMLVIGWAWAEQYIQPNMSVTLAGSLDGRWWQGPLRSLNADPVGVQFHPGVKLRKDGTQLSVMMFSQFGGGRGSPALQAFMAVPESGSW